MLLVNIDQISDGFINFSSMYTWYTGHAVIHLVNILNNMQQGPETG